MAVYKELLNVIKEVQARSEQVWQDSCDFGVPIYSLSHPLLKLVKGVKEQYGGKTSTDKYETGATQKVKIEGLDEFSTGRKFTASFEWVTTRRDRNGMIGILSVEVSGLG